MSGYRNGREAACYSMHQLTHPVNQPPEQGPNFSPEYPILPQFPVLFVPSPDPLYPELIGRFAPVCTWDRCLTDPHRLKPNHEWNIDGNQLIPFTDQNEDFIAFILLEHLERKHQFRRIVAPYEPYGIILQYASNEELEYLASLNKRMQLPRETFF